LALDTVLNTYTNDPITSGVPGTELVLLHVNLKASETYLKGSAIGEITATPGTFGPYASGASDGTETPTAIVPFTCVSASSGLITVGTTADPAGLTHKSVPAIFGGYVRAQDIVGLDADLKSHLGKLIKGTASAGIFKIN
jgi:hypothetical protein